MLEYLQSKLADDLQETLLLAPALLAYSLENRIKPRMETILAAGISPLSITVGITFAEEKFKTWLQGKIKREVSSYKNRKDCTTQTTATTTASAAEAIEDRNARIVHWNQKRK